MPVDAELFRFGWSLDWAPVLRTTDGEEVPARVRREAGVDRTTWFLVAPLDELAPNTEYEFGSVQFTTGKGRTSLPDAADIVAFSAAHSELGACFFGLCSPQGVAYSSSLIYRPSADAVYYELVVTVAGEPWRRLAPNDFYGALDNGVCGDAPEITPGQTACAELVAVGASGARAASGTIECSEGRSCEVNDECDPTPLEDCHRPDFLPGAVEVPPPNNGDSGCSVHGKGQASTAFFLLLLLLGIRPRRTEAVPCGSLSWVKPRTIS